MIINIPANNQIKSTFTNHLIPLPNQSSKVQKNNKFNIQKDAKGIKFEPKVRNRTTTLFF